MDKKEKLNNEVKKNAGGAFANSDNHIPKDVRETYFTDKGNRSKNRK
ncbi:hypothetical protein GH741_07435 [Aquibacillus halophilus]|uniref:Uncharacterized protein n=1 Tax=Aquibacillus halophilus TaxID=930132 RepID=A0A6A8DDB0_9BACI|nr:hypothetical protein [Aquibacillus halophilus]MRH42516.1 hypothetical protein [Aquibacillus halophilus]